MKQMILGLVGVVAFLSTAQGAFAEQIKLACASSPTSSPMYLVVDLSAATVTIESWGTYSAQITEHEITWTGPGQSLQKLSRDTGQWETFNPDGSGGALQCKRREAVF